MESGIMKASSKGSVLIVDDTLENLEVLEGLLSEQGYDVRQAIDGPMALMGVAADPPDLILLDIMMPDMDGYEVCRHLKSAPESWDIPVIFISALDDAFDKVKAFECGGVDYIPKPFQAAEALARVQNQMSLAQLKKVLQLNTEVQFQQLQQLQQDLEEVTWQYQELVDYAPVGIYQASPDGRYLKANTALASLHGYPSPDVWFQAQGAHGIRIPYVDPHHWQKLLGILMVKGRVTSLPAEVVRADGSIIEILESVRPVKDRQGQLMYYEGYVQRWVDLADLKAD